MCQFYIQFKHDAQNEIANQKKNGTTATMSGRKAIEKTSVGNEKWKIQTITSAAALLNVVSSNGIECDRDSKKKEIYSFNSTLNWNKYARARLKLRVIDAVAAVYDTQQNASQHALLHFVSTSYGSRFFLLSANIFFCIVNFSIKTTKWQQEMDE